MRETIGSVQRLARYNDGEDEDIDGDAGDDEGKEIITDI